MVNKGKLPLVVSVSYVISIKMKEEFMISKYVSYVTVVNYEENLKVSLKLYNNNKSGKAENLASRSIQLTFTFITRYKSETCKLI